MLDNMEKVQFLVQAPWRLQGVDIQVGSGWRECALLLRQIVWMGVHIWVNYYFVRERGVLCLGFPDRQCARG